MRAYFLYIVFCLAIGSYCAQDRIYWNEGKSLNYSDFKGNPDNKNIAALSFCGMTCFSCNSRGEPVYRVRAYFEPHNSWIWFNYKYRYVLRHEQLHFDIAELYVRKLRKYLSENKVSFRQSEIVFKKYYNLYEEAQEQYDRQTYHGTYSSKQKEWEQYISEQLLALEDYNEDRCY